MLPDLQMRLWVGIPTHISCRTPERMKTSIDARMGGHPLDTSGTYTCLFMKWYTGLFHIVQYDLTSGVFHQSS